MPAIDTGRYLISGGNHQLAQRIYYHLKTQSRLVKIYETNFWESILETDRDYSALTDH